MLMDNPVEPRGGDDYDHLGGRVMRLEGDVQDIKDTLHDLKVMVARIDAQIPYLATKAEIAGLEAKLAEKPSQTYMWGILAALLTAYACGLAALAVLK